MTSPPPSATPSPPIVSNDFRVVLAMLLIGFAIFMGWMAAWIELRQKTFTMPTLGEDALILVPMVLGFATLLPQTVTFLVATVKPILPSWGRRDT